MFLPIAKRPGGLGDIVSDNTAFLQLTPAQVLALTAYGEARGEGDEGMAAIVNVVNNRTASKQFYDNSILQAVGDLIHAVVLKKNQFSIFNRNNPNRKILLNIAQDFNTALGNYPSLQTAYELANQLLNGTLQDNVAGAIYYHPKGIKPRWAKKMQMVAEIGRHLFYTS